MGSIPDWMTVTPALASAWERGHLGAVPIAPDVWVVGSPIPEGTLPYTLTYLLGGADGSVSIIDPGWDSDENHASLLAALAQAGWTVDAVSTVVATHHHPDHLGLAHRLRDDSGARILITATERAVLAQETSPARWDRARHEAVLDNWGVPSARKPELLATFDRPSLIDDVEPDEFVADDAVLDLGGHRLRVITTPGHTDGHLCLVDEHRGLVYTGDHVLPRIFSGIGIGTLPGSTPLADYLDSLDKIAPFDDLLGLPGHEFTFEGLSPRRAELSAHQLRRTRETAAIQAELGNASVWEYASRLSWTAGWDGLEGYLLDSALRQTEMHLGLVVSGAARVLLDRAADEAAR